MSKRKKFNFSTASRNPALWRLKYEVDDTRFLQIFADFASLIRRSEKARERAAKQGNADYAEFVGESEAEYLEEIIGASFLILQAKIRRVTVAVQRLREFARDQHKIELGGLGRTRVMSLDGPFKKNAPSQINLIWAIANYFKHRDEWQHDAWKDKKPKEQEDHALRQARETRRVVENAGIVEFSTGNMRTAYEYFGIDPYSKCELLARDVQDWSERVYGEAHRLAKKAAPKVP